MALDKTFKPGKGINITDDVYVGLLQSIVHVGSQKVEYEGKVSYKDQAVFTFELQDVLLDDGTPISMSKTENIATGPRAGLTKLIKAITRSEIDTDGIDFESLIGKSVMLDIQKNSKGNPNIKAYSRVPSGLQKTIKPLTREPRLVFDVDSISDKDFKELPEWMQKKINERVKEGKDNGEKGAIEY